MREIELTIRIPEDLVKEASVLGSLTSEYIAALIRADIQAQLIAMANDPDIQREITQIDAEFRATETDGLEKYG